MFDDLISIVLVLVIPRLLSGSLVSFFSAHSSVLSIGIVIVDVIIWYPSKYIYVLPYTCVFFLKVLFSNSFVNIRYRDTSFLALGLN